MKLPVSAQAIVVVDDEPDLLTVMTMMLEKNGYQVHGFVDPTKALDHIIACANCGILVTDFRMPGMSGVQLVKAVKKIRPKMKVVLMTAFQVHTEEWQQVLPSTEVDHFIEKPARLSDLVETIKNLTPEIS